MLLYKSSEGVFKMKNGKNIFGIIVLLLTVVFLSVSCNLELEYTWKFDNQSSFEVNIFSANVDPSSFTLAKGTSRTFTNDKTSVSFQYTPADKVEATADTNTTGGTFTFRNR
jgi:hypothetical protein